MTDQEFVDWWHRQTFGRNTKAQRNAWTKFIRAHEVEFGITTNLIKDIPPHAREAFMAGYALIFD